MTKRQFFFRYAKGQEGLLALLALLTLASAAAALASPALARGFLDEAKGSGSFSHLVATALVVVGVALAGQLLSVARTWTAELAAWRSTNSLREDLAAHLLSLDMGFHKSHKPGELIERVDGDVEETRAFYSLLFTELAAAVPLFVGVIGALAAVDLRLGAATLAASLVAVVSYPFINKARMPRLARVREVHAKLSGDLQEWIAGREDIQAASAEDVMLNRLHRRYGERYLASLALLPSNTLGAVMPFVVLALAYAAAYWLGSGALGAALPVGTMTMVILYLDKLQEPIWSFSRGFQWLAMSGASFGRISELLDERSALRRGTAELAPPGALALRIENLRFGYEGRDVLEGVSLELGPGERLGLIGRTGSGKTTVARLVTHLYEPRSGAVLLGDGERFLEPGELEPACLERLVAMVTQEVELFHASVRDNLTLFDASIPDESIHDALRKVTMDGWLAKRPEGLDTRLSGAAGLSAGEAQLLSLARVFLRDPRLVILDEASSRLDPATERRMEQAVAALLEGRTAVVIAHRLETVLRADRVVILDAGRVVESGRRAELVADPESRLSGLLRSGMAEALA